MSNPCRIHVVVRAEAHESQMPILGPWTNARLAVLEQSAGVAVGRRRHAGRRGSTTARGYDSRHQRLRARLAPIVATDTVTCARCGRLIGPGQPWDLGHVDGVKTRYTGPVDADGDRTAGAQQRNRLCDPDPEIRPWW
jgi:hypothetical protein